jgi:hypothetical protein
MVKHQMHKILCIGVTLKPIPYSEEIEGEDSKYKV